MKSENIARWAEIIASLGVIVTLVLLVREVRANTLTLERQALVERANTLYSPYLGESQIPTILAKVKRVDGPEPLEEVFIERYDLSYEEAAIWSRYLGTIWNGLEADYTLLGESEDIANRIRLFLERFPDIRLWWEHASPLLAGPEFRVYVERLRSEA